MTPLELMILLHYYCGGTDFRDGDFRAPAVRSTIDHFRTTAEFLEEEVDAPDRTRVYRLTERGRLFVDAVLATPLPERRWVMPCRGVPA